MNVEEGREERMVKDRSLFQVFQVPYNFETVSGLVSGGYSSILYFFNYFSTIQSEGKRSFIMGRAITASRTGPKSEQSTFMCNICFNFTNRT